ncbi:Cyclin N-terminal domain-containing protein [Mycena chlorophos]|uniref:Cyclin N-terminal domain-containing protein n=1 Tax=Mycena chlorophos TaxID=658473 RepID=A0A8H6SXB3_MYCCL|nr:Cyclin N-terminal domain-containing protein [Mycena chlorophos]
MAWTIPLAPYEVHWTSSWIKLGLGGAGFVSATEPQADSHACPGDLARGVVVLVRQHAMLCLDPFYDMRFPSADAMYVAAGFRRCICPQSHQQRRLPHFWSHPGTVVGAHNIVGRAVRT